MKFDDVLEYIGEFGAYQRRLYILMNLTSICIAFQAMAPVFMFYVPEHRCSLPNYKNDTYAIQNANHGHMVKEIIPPSAPGEGGKYDPCTYRDYDKVHHSKTLTCHSWVYNQSEFTSTVASQLDLVCERKHIRSHANMAMMTGNLVGAFAQGVSSDYFGRKKAFCVGLLMFVASSFFNIFLNGFFSLMLFRFLIGVANNCVLMSAFVIGIEFVGPSKRKIAGVGLQFFWVGGLYLLTLIVFLIRSWQGLMIALALPTLLYLPLLCFVQESPRWLISNGRSDDADVIIRKAAVYNGATLPDNAKLEAQGLMGHEEKKETMMTLFASRVMAFRAIFIFLNWGVCSMVYYGLALNISNMGGNIFLNFFVAATLEGVGNVLCYLLLDRLGRKKLYIASLLVGGISCAASIVPLMFYPKLADKSLMLLSWIGRMGITSAFSTIYIYTAEMFPTALRNSVLGSSSLTARIGSILSPYIADAGLSMGGIYVKGLPFFVFGLFSVVAAVMSMTFPETLNRKLPDTLEDAENMGTSKVRHQI